MQKLYILFAVLVLGSCKKQDKLFTLLDDSDTGIKFNNFIDSDSENNVLLYGYFYNGGGVAAADFNNDSLVDLYFTGNMVANKLYLNKGEMQFEDISEKSGTALNKGWKTGVSVVDINDDGWIDIYVCRAGAQDPDLRRNLLYVNNGKTPDGIPTFTERAAEYGLDDPSYTTQAVFFDYDRDGDTDCFLLNHSIQKYAGFSNLIANYRNERDEAYGNKLLRNDRGRYVNVTDSAGIVSNVLSFGLGVNVNDFNNDGWQDIYISNDYNENDYLYLNQKNGSFKEVIRDATGHVSMYSMGTDAADINNDGLTDILTLDMLPASNERIKLTSGDDNYDKYQQLIKAGFHDQSMRNMLQLNNGVNKEGVPVFSEIGQLAGISNTDWSWSALMADFDNDGWKDIFVTNGYPRDYTNMDFLKFSSERQLDTKPGDKPLTQMEIIDKMPPIDEPNYIFKNERNLTFSKKLEEWGFSEKSQSNGAIYADLDNDGDLDLVTNNIGDKAFVYRNNSDQKASGFLSVALKAPAYSLKAGAVVSIYSGDSLTQTQSFMPVRGFQSAIWDNLHFGLGNIEKLDSLKIVWADGHSQVLKNVSGNQKIVLSYTKASAHVGSEVINTSGLWQQVSALDYRHEEDIVNDFRIQTLIPNMLSYSGPNFSKKDLNGDGIEDIYIGGPHGQSGALFLSKQVGKWQRLNVPAFEEDKAFEDGQSVFFDADGDGDNDLVVASEGYRLNEGDPLLQTRLYFNEKGTWRRAGFPEIKINAPIVKVADMDRDGDQDLILGVRVTPGRFPESSGGILLMNDGKGNFTNKTISLAPALAKAGMVTDAVWQDLNKDGYPELLLTTDWMPVQVFLNQKGKLLNATAQWGTAALDGCWNVIKSADLDGDGDIDFVVGNMGQNWQWNIVSPAGISMYAADFDKLNRTVPVISVFENGQEYPFASRDELLDQIPSLKKKYTNYADYSRATLSEMLSVNQLNSASHLKSTEWRSGVLENKNGKLIFHPLPIQAQFSPTYAISLADVNADGKTDIFLGGNLTHTRVRLGKNDANLVDVFLNRGNMRFDYQPQIISGLFVKGDVRDLLTIKAGNSDFLFVGVNNDALSVFKLRK